MKNIPKYILISIYTIVYLYIVGSRFELNDYILYTICAAGALVVSFLLSSYLNKNAFSRIFLISTFVVIIAIPLSGKREDDSFEKRELAEFPQMRLSNVWKFFYGYQEYFNDRFAFRNSAVQLISKVRLHTFNISTMPHLVELGKDNWLYTTRTDYVHDLSTPFTPEQLDSAELHLEIITKYFDIRKIKFYFAMIPVKERIYPENMSDLLKIKMQFSKAAQLNDRIRNNPRIRSIDVKNVLIEGKKTLPTYYTTDTHWNQYGCFLAYREIITRIKEDFPEIEPSVLSDYRIDTATTDAGDLQLMMGFRNEFHFKHINLIPKSPLEPVVLDSTNQGPPSWRYAIREMPSVKNNLKLVIVRDSFTEYLRIFMSRDFKRTELIWTPVLPVGKIMQVKPDIILQEILELYVMKTLQLPPEIASDTLFLNTYFPQYLNPIN